MSSVRAAVVGCGHQGAKHVDAYAAIDDVELVAVVDRSPERLAEVGDRHGIPAERRFTSHEQLTRDLGLDLVSVVTMPASHTEITLACLAAGANVLCEKPIAPTAADVERMVAAAADAGRFVTGAFNMRYMGSAQQLRGLVEDGTLGQPVAIRATCLDVDIPWWGPHYVKELSGGGVIAADAGHVLDLALWAAGSPRVLTVSASARSTYPTKRTDSAPSAAQAAQYDVEDAAGGFMRLDNGSWLLLELSWAADLPEPIFGFELQCEGGSGRLDPFRVILERDGVPVDVTPHERADNNWDSSVRRGIVSVVDAVRSGTPPLVTPEQMLHVQELIDALYRSAESGREVVLA
jgi:predicted dehydrogenase